MISAIDVVVPTLTFAFFVAVGLDLTPDDFAALRRKRALVLTGLLAPLVLLPLVALSLIWIFRPGADIAAGMMLIAVCPIGGISNTYSYLARASTSLSVTLTGLSCLCAGITIPLVCRGLELLLGQSFGFRAPVAFLMVYLAVVFALPLALGMSARRYVPALAEQHKPALQRLVFVGVIVVLVLLILADVGAFLRELSTTVPLSAAFVVASMIVGWATAALVTRDHGDRFTVAAEFATRNVGVSTAVAVTILGRLEVARFGAAYFLTEVPLMLLIAMLYRRRRTAFNGE